jgi:hypothetical protein
MNAALVAAITVALSAPLAAQWLTQPTPGIPQAESERAGTAHA